MMKCRGHMCILICVKPRFLKIYILTECLITFDDNILNSIQFKSFL